MTDTRHTIITRILRLTAAAATAVCMLIALSGCSSSDEIAKGNLTQIIRSGSKTIQAEPKADDYVIRQGDQIQFSVWGYPEFTTQALVKESGSLTIPLIGDILVSGSTKEQFVKEVRKRLSEYVQGDIQITINILSATAQKVSVIGAVTKQENYPVTSDLSLLEVLSMAGGTTPDSDLRHVRILRAGLDRQPIEVDLMWYIENGNIDAVPIVRPGDTIFIPKRGNVIRELSDFLRDAVFILGFFRVFN
jgi:polysaccharide export outer membrane protein